MIRRHFGLVLVAGLVLAGLAAHSTVTLMPLARAEGPTAKVILAGGCFWCLEHDFNALPGVVNAVSGYSGGSRPMPTYENYHDVDAANPKPHVEVVEVTYDTAKLSFAAVLDYYFRHVDPTDDGGQFCDRGPAYRPVVFFGNADEKAMAEAKAKEVAGLIKQPVKVGIEPAETFWAAEDYHQDYAGKNPIKYKYYRWNCGRDQRVEEVWSLAPS
jgi:peptide-methionine (S)-S-oxide reductase